jgi:hypothetical protein
MCWTGGRGIVRTEFSSPVHEENSFVPLKICMTKQLATQVENYGQTISLVEQNTYKMCLK